MEKGRDQQKNLRLEEEIERSRTSLEVVGDFLVSAAAYAEDVGDKLEPWRKWADSIANLLGQARKVEDNQPELPAPSKPKEIEGPKGDD